MENLTTSRTPSLIKQQEESLDANITILDVVLGTAKLQPNKAPGKDGYNPTSKQDFQPTFSADPDTPVNSFASIGSLTDTMKEEVITGILKHGKDPT